MVHLPFKRPHHRTVSWNPYVALSDLGRWQIRKLISGAQNLESYVDDILGHASDWESHLKTLRDFFERVKCANLSLKPSKCKIGYDTVDFLGHPLKENVIGRQRDNVGKILNTERPKNKKSLRSLLGTVNFYRRYIPNYASILSPLTELTKNRMPNELIWLDRHERAFQRVT